MTGSSRPGHRSGAGQELAVQADHLLIPGPGGARMGEVARSVVGFSGAATRSGAVRTSRLHQFTAKLARAHGVVVVENIATANLMRNHHLAQAIGDQGWGELSRQLRYKTTRAGGTLLPADR